MNYILFCLLKKLKKYQFILHSLEILVRNVTCLQRIHSIQQDSTFSFSEVFAQFFSFYALVTWIAVYPKHHLSVYSIPKLRYLSLLSFVSLKQLFKQHNSFCWKHIRLLISDKTQVLILKILRDNKSHKRCEITASVHLV